MNNDYQHRIGTKTIKLTDNNGETLKNKTVLVKQQKHKFLFGAAEWDALPLANGELEGETKAIVEARMEKIYDIFNFMTLPFYWGRFEPEQGKPDTARIECLAKYLKDKNMTLKGHPLCWHTVPANWLLDLSNEEILKVQLDRIHREVTHFSGLVDIWDVINEVVIMPIFDKYDNGITRICKDLGRIELVRQVFNAAKEANPNALLLINDFDMSEAYDILIEGLLEADIPIGAIGLQSHMHQGYWGVEKTEEILERFSRFKLPIHFTENNIVSGRIMPKHIVDLNDHKVDTWDTTPMGEERQAMEMKFHYKTLFKHPLVESITYWDFVDGGWLKAPTGFVTRDGRVKPVYDEIHKLIKGEWWSGEQKVITDSEGNAVVSGYKGDYTAECENTKLQFTIE